MKSIILDGKDTEVQLFYTYMWNKKKDEQKLQGCMSEVQ